MLMKKNVQTVRLYRYDLALEKRDMYAVNIHTTSINIKHPVVFFFSRAGCKIYLNICTKEIPDFLSKYSML